MSEVAALKKKVCQEIKSHLMFFIAKGLQPTALNKFYYEDTGKSIPFKELGFSSLIAFLQSIPEVVQVRSGYPEPQIFLVSDEKTKHIEKLSAITAVKNNRNRAYRNSRGYSRQNYPFEAIRKAFSQVTQGCVPIISREKIAALLKEFGTTGTPIANIQSHYQKKNGMVINFGYFGFPSLEKCLSSIPNIVTLKTDLRNNIVCVSTEEIKKAHENDLKFIVRNTQIEKVSASTNVQFNNKVVTIPAITQHPPSQQSFGEFSSEEENLNNKLKKKMRRVLKQHPNGLCIDTLLDEYERINHEILNLEDTGYSDITELVDQNPNIFGIFLSDDPKTSEIIYDARSQRPDFVSYTPKKTKDIPKDVIGNIKSILESYPDGLSVREFEASYKINCKSELQWRYFGFSTKEDFYLKLSEYIRLVITISHGEKHLRMEDQKSKFVAPSTILCDNELIVTPVVGVYVPEDAATCKDKYIQQTILSHEDIDDYMGVLVSDVESPGSFYIQLLGEQYADALERLMDNLEKFYQSYPVSQNYKIPHHEFKVNLPCAALYEEDWHRATIVGLQSRNEIVEVFYVDYGTSGQVSKDYVRFIPKKFMKLPSQAIKCKLGLLQPINVQRGWTITSRYRLLELIKLKDLQCKFLHTRGLDYKKGLEIVITDTTGEDDIQINDLMIQEGHAQKCLEDINLIPNIEKDDAASVRSSASAVVEEFEQKSKQNVAESEKVPNRPKQTFPESVQRSKAKSPAGGLVNSQTLNVDILQRILELKRNKSPKCTNINNFDFSIFSGVPSTPCPNLLSTPQSLNHSRASTPMPSSPIQPVNSKRNVTPDILNSIHGEPQQNLNQFTTATSQLSQHVFEATHLSSENIDIPKPLASTVSILPQAAKVNETTDAKDTNSQKRYSKQITFLTGYSGRIINYEKKPYLTSADLSTFIFATNNLIINLFRRMKIKVETINIEAEECPDLFAELKKVNARGFEVSEVKHLTLFPLASCVEALRIYPNNALENAIQQSLKNFDPDDSFWLENEDDYANLTPELLQAEIDQLIIKRKSCVSLLQNSDPRNVENHLAYTDLMSDLFYAIQIQKIMMENNSQSDAVTDLNKTLSDLFINSPPKRAKNVQAVAPMVSNEITLPTTTSSTVQTATSDLRITLAARNNSIPMQETLPTTTSVMHQANPMASVNQVHTSNSLMTGPPLMMPMVGFPGMTHNSMGYPMGMNFNMPYQQCFFPSPQQFRPFYNQFSFYNPMNNNNANNK